MRIGVATPKKPSAYQQQYSSQGMKWCYWLCSAVEFEDLKSDSFYFF
jgi:hypothetical protein